MCPELCPLWVLIGQRAALASLPLPPLSPKVARTKWCPHPSCCLCSSLTCQSLQVAQGEIHNPPGRVKCDGCLLLGLLCPRGARAATQLPACHIAGNSSSFLEARRLAGPLLRRLQGIAPAACVS